MKKITLTCWMMIATAQFSLYAETTTAEAVGVGQPDKTVVSAADTQLLANAVIEKSAKEETMKITNSVRPISITLIDKSSTTDEGPARYFTLDGMEISEDNMSGGIYVKVTKGDQLKFLIK